MKITDRGIAAGITAGLVGLAGVSVALNRGEPNAQRELAASSLFDAARDTSRDVTALQMTIGGQETVPLISTLIANNQTARIAEVVEQAKKMHEQLGEDLAKWEAAVKEFEKTTKSDSRK